ncbi:MAG: hypothetical protein V3S31_06965 [Dehalococcoidia bacterium]
MTASETRLFEGRWRTLPNLAADLKDSIHDDDRARELGFRGGFVPGPTVAEAVTPAILGHFGQRWFEGGWYDLKFITPVYTDDEVQEVAEPFDDTPDTVAVKLLTRDGRLTCGGRAGLGTAVPWDPDQDGQRLGDIAFPHLTLGQSSEEVEFTIEPDDFARQLDAAGNDSPWFRESSPWGGPIASSIALMRQAQHLTGLPLGDGVTPPGINADFQIVVERPVFVGRSHRVTARLANKGVSGRCWFRTVEFTIRDADGNHCATGRQNVKWFAAG